MTHFISLCVLPSFLLLPISAQAAEILGAFEDLARKPFPELHALASLSDADRLAACREAKEKWPSFENWLRAQPARSLTTAAASQRFLAFTAAVCNERFELLHEYIVKLGSIGGPFLGANYGQPGTILKILPSPLFTEKREGDKITLDSRRAFDFFFPEVARGALTADCRHNLYSRMNVPPIAACMADWFWVNLSESEAVAHSPLGMDAKKELQRKVEQWTSRNRPASWSSLLSLPFQTSPQGSVPRYSGSSAVLENFLGLAPEKASSVLNGQGAALNVALQGGPGTTRMACGKVAEAVAATLRVAPPQNTFNDSVFLPTLGRILVESCAGKSLKLSRDLEKQLPASYGFESAMSQVEGAHSAVISEGESLSDMRLREALDLRFHYGSEFDLEDYRSYSVDEKRHAAIDTSIATAIRSSSLVPWVHLAQNIEDVAQLQDLMAQTLVALGTHDSPAKRIVQFLYLESLDVAPLNWGEAPELNKLIREIRDLSQVLRAEVPEMRPLANLIHNGLHAGLIEATEKVQQELDAKGAQEYGAYFDRLKAVMRSLFSLDKTRVERITKLAGAWATARGFEASAPAAASSSAALRALARKVASDLDLLDRTPSPDRRRYIFGLRLLKEIHLALVEIHNAEAPRGNAGPLIDLTHLSSRKLKAEQVRSELERLYGERLARARWFVFTQSRRASKNTEIQKAYPSRMQAIDAFLSLQAEKYGLAVAPSGGKT